MKGIQDFVTQCINHSPRRFGYKPLSSKHKHHNAPILDSLECTTHSFKSQETRAGVGQMAIPKRTPYLRFSSFVDKSVLNAIFLCYLILNITEHTRSNFGWSHYKIVVYTAYETTRTDKRTRQSYTTEIWRLARRWGEHSFLYDAIIRCGGKRTMNNISLLWNV